MAHLHDIVDTDARYVIDPTTRAITNMAEAEPVIVQGDHNSERLTFELPRYIEQHDMSLCNVVQVHYINIGRNASETQKGLYEVSDLHMSSADENKVECSWTISRNATMYAGTLRFIVSFKCVTADTPDYVWNTAIYEKLTVRDGISNSEVIAEDYADILEAWRQELLNIAQIDSDDLLKAVAVHMQDHYPNPYNYLINSYFVVPQRIINQYGFEGGSVSGSTPIIDGWNLLNSNDNSLYLNEGGIALKGYLQQRVTAKAEGLVGKPVTLAAKIDGKVCVLQAEMGIASNVAGLSMSNLTSQSGSLGVVTVSIAKTSGAVVEWAALYEGHYTAETLPAYVPKPYLEELMDCERRYRRWSELYIFGKHMHTAAGKSMVQLYVPLRAPAVCQAQLFFNGTAHITCGGKTVLAKSETDTAISASQVSGKEGRFSLSFTEAFDMPTDTVCMIEATDVVLDTKNFFY